MADIRVPSSAWKKYFGRLEEKSASVSNLQISPSIEKAGSYLRLFVEDA